VLLKTSKLANFIKHQMLLTPWTLKNCLTSQTAYYITHFAILLLHLEVVRNRYTTLAYKVKLWLVLGVTRTQETPSKFANSMEYRMHLTHHLKFIDITSFILHYSSRESIVAFRPPDKQVFHPGHWYVSDLLYLIYPRPSWFLNPNFPTYQVLGFI
jgi:hypothetical protein